METSELILEIFSLFGPVTVSLKFKNSFDVSCSKHYFEMFIHQNLNNLINNEIVFIKIYNSEIKNKNDSMY